jgi:fibronectin-binding autotransporter adhesin
MQAARGARFRVAGFLFKLSKEPKGFKMKNNKLPRSICLCRSAAGMGMIVVLGLVFLIGPLGSLTHAAALSWDPNATGGTALGGNGVWDAASWWSSGSDGPWMPGADAYFGGTAGTVSLIDPVTANNLFFGASGYLVTGNTLTLTGGTVNVPTALSATIGAGLAGSGNSSLTLTGAGALVLNGPASYTGPTTTSGGTLLINNTDTTSSISVGLATVLGGTGSASSATATFASTKGTLAPGYGGAGSLTLGGLNTGSASDVVSIIIPTISDATSVPAVNVIGNVTCAKPTNVTFYLTGVLSGSGSIPLLYAGSGIMQLNGAKFNAQNITGGGSVTLSENAATGYLDLNYSGYTYLVWSGTGSGVWSTAPQSPTNWLVSSGSPTNFTNNQAVVFNDAATATPAVSVSGNVAPASVTFNNNSKSYTLTGAGGISGYTGLVMNGSGSVTIGNSNSYTGGTTINAGRLNIANSAALGGPTTTNTYGAFTINGGSVDNTSSGPLALPNYPIAWNAGFVFPGSNPLNLGTGSVTLGNSAATVNLSGSTLTLGGPIGDNGMGYGFTQSGAGVLALGGSSTYSGQTAVNGGTLSLGNGASINGTSGVNLAASNTVLVFNHTDSQTFTPSVGGPGGLVQTGGMVTLANSNTYTGATAITGGTLALGNPLALQNSTLNTSGSGTLSFGSLTAATLGGLTGPGTLALGNTASSAVTLSVGNDNANTTFSGTLTGPGGLSKMGAGSLWLSGSNSFAGTTNVSGGTLGVANAAALQNSTVNVAANTNIVFSVSAASVGGLSGTGNLNLGTAVLTVGANNASSYFPGSLSGGNGLTKAGNGTLIMTGMNTYGGPTVINAGTVQLGDGIVGFGANTTSGTFTGTNGTWQFNSNGAAYTTTPMTSGVLTLTQSTLGTSSRSAFNNIPVTVGPFNASFVYQDASKNGADGVVFMLQSQGLTALGDPGGSLGYAGANLYTPGIAPSAGLGFNLYTSGQSGSSSLYQLSGGMLVSSVSTTNSFSPGTSVNLDSGDPIQVNISYDGSSNLTITLSDSAAGSSYTNSYSVGSLVSAVSSSAYVGFSGGDGGSSSTQKISNFSFSYNTGTLTNVLPATTALSVAAGATLDLSGNSQTVGSLTGSGTVTNYSTNALSVLTAGGDNSSQTFSGALLDGYGTLGLIKVGSGNLTLTGSNVYSGGTTVSGGTLQLGNGTTKNGSLAGDILNNSTLVFANPAAQLYTGLISGSGSLIKNAPGTLQLGATHTYAGPTVINAGTVQLGYAATVSGFGANTTGGTGVGGVATTGTGNGTWSFNSYSYNYGFNRTPVTGGSLDLTDGSLSTSAAGTYGTGEARSAFYNTPVPVNNSFLVTFTYAPSYPGGVGFASTANYNNGFALVIAGSGGTSLGGAGRGFGVGDDPEGNYNNNPISPSAEIVYDVFQGYKGNGLVYSTTGAATGYNTNGAVATNIPILGGKSYTIGDPINMTITYNSLTNVLSWSGTDAGKSLTFSESQAGVNLQSITGGTGGFIGFTGANGYNDSTQTVTNFSFSSAVNGNLPSMTALFISKSGALDLFGADQTVGDLSGAGTVTNSFPATAATLTTGGDGSSQTFSGAIQNGAGAVALTLVGGTLTFSGTNNSYSGGTYVEDGTLFVTNPAAIADGTSLTVGNPADFAPVIPALPSSAIAPVPEPATLTLSIAGLVAWCAASLRRKRRGA